MSNEHPRVLAVCVFRDGDRILVAEGSDSVKGQMFYRPLGGGVKFGEYGEDAVIREIKEELDADVHDVRFLGAIENVFTYEGDIGHEVVLVFDGTLADPLVYRAEAVEGIEENGMKIRAVWKGLAEFASIDAPPLYPTGLLDLLRDQP